MLPRHGQRRWPAGANPQRLLWASTAPKDPSLRVDLDAAGDELLAAGVRSFEEAYDEALADIAARVSRLTPARRGGSRSRRVAAAAG
jgi:hypothetical protein